MKDTSGGDFSLPDKTSCVRRILFLSINLQGHLKSPYNQDGFLKSSEDESGVEFSSGLC